MNVLHQFITETLNMEVALERINVRMQLEKQMTKNLIEQKLL